MKSPKRSSMKASSNTTPAALWPPRITATSAAPSSATASSVIGPSLVLAAKGADQEQDDRAERQDGLRQRMSDFKTKRIHGTALNAA